MTTRFFALTAALLLTTQARAQAPFTHSIPIEAPAGTNGMHPELTFGNRKLNVAPWGHRGMNKGFARFPHYHRNVPDPTRPGQSLPGQGMGLHRPYEGGF